MRWLQQESDSWRGRKQDSGQHRHTHTHLLVALDNVVVGNANLLPDALGLVVSGDAILVAALKVRHVETVLVELQSGVEEGAWARRGGEKERKREQSKGDETTGSVEERRRARTLKTSVSSSHDHLMDSSLK